MKSEKTHYDLIVIGGGSSGMTAAGFAGKRGRSVLILEKNDDLGEKLKITGGGRCNITNYELDDRKLLKHYGDAAPFLFSAFSQFSVKDTFTFFEKRKLPLVTQARNRVFPKTERAYDVYLVLKKFVTENNVDIHYRSNVNKVHKEGNRINAIEVGGKRYTAENYIFATGGVSHPETGSTGDGFKWAQSLGHKVNEPTPDIVPLRSSDPWVSRMSGVSLSFMKINFFLNYEKKFSKTGKVLFTHFGLSGPLILNSSREVANLLKEGYVHAEIDLFPDTDAKSLDQRVVKIFDTNKNRDFKNVLEELVPKKLAPEIFAMMRISDVHHKVHSVTAEQRKQLVQILKSLTLSIDSLMGLDRAVVADGGIPLSEVNTRTMQSKIIENLYLTGDMLHVNRPSGGYSLQLCWTTGYVAGMNA
jgi:predicted Rossmann fold flavoprotein